LEKKHPLPANHSTDLRRVKRAATIIAQILNGLYLTTIVMLVFGSQAYSHSGMVDSRGGHNCYIGSCAGTYHFHGGSSPESATGWIITLLVFGGIGYFIFRSTGSGKKSTPNRREYPREIKPAPPKRNARSQEPQRMEFKKAFTRPVICELHAVAHLIDWNVLSPAFEKWILGYLSGFLLYASNPKDPLEILNVGMWSQQAAWDRLSEDIIQFLDALGKHDKAVADLKIESVKPHLSEYLITDENWIVGARDGCSQAKDWNTVGSVLPIIEKRWSERQ
jgi:hypothetical protein